MEENPELDVSLRTLGTIAAVALIILTVLSVGYTINEGERGVQVRLGKVVGEPSPGLNYKAPWISSVQTYSVRTQAYTSTAKRGEGEIAKKNDAIVVPDNEGVTVGFNATVRYQIDGDRVGYIYTDITKSEARLRQDFIRPDIFRSFRVCMAERNVTSVYTRDSGENDSEEMETCVRETLQPRLEEIGVELKAVSIRGVTMDRTILEQINKQRRMDETLKIEQKQIKIEQAKAQQRIEEARGIRKAQQIINETLTEEYLQWFWIKEGIEKGDTVWVVSSDRPGIPTFTEEMNATPPTSDSGNASATVPIDYNGTDTDPANETTTTSAAG